MENPKKYKAPETNFTCLVSGFRNCLIKLEFKASERYLRKLMKVDKTHGAGLAYPRNLIRGIKYYDLDFKINYSTSPNIFKRKLLKALKNNKVCLILIEDCNHWISALEYKNKRIKIVDGDFKKYAHKNIVQEMTPKEIVLMAANFDRLFYQKNFFEFVEISKKI